MLRFSTRYNCVKCAISLTVCMKQFQSKWICCYGVAVTNVWHNQGSFIRILIIIRFLLQFQIVPSFHVCRGPSAADPLDSCGCRVALFACCHSELIDKAPSWKKSSWPCIRVLIHIPGGLCVEGVIFCHARWFRHHHPYNTGTIVWACECGY